MHRLCLLALLLLNVCLGSAYGATSPDIVVINKTWGTITIPSGGGISGYPAQVGVVTTLIYEIKNPGSAPLRLSPTMLTGIQNCTAKIKKQPASTIRAHGSSQLVIQFTPAAFGIWQFVVSIPSNAAASPVYHWIANGEAQTTLPIVAIYDNGLRLSKCANVRIASSTIGVAVAKTLSVANLGTGPLQITAVSLGRRTGCTASFSVAPDYLSFVGVGESDPLGLNLTPTVVGPWSAVVTITTNDPKHRTVRVIISGDASPVVPVFAN